jgi:hypothetical protein
VATLSIWAFTEPANKPSKQINNSFFNRTIFPLKFTVNALIASLDFVPISDFLIMPIQEWDKNTFYHPKRVGNYPAR